MIHLHYFKTTLLFLFLIATSAQASLDDSGDYIKPLFNNRSIENVPSSFKGRFRPLSATGKLWLYDVYHHQEIKKKHQSLFLMDGQSPAELLLKLHFFGHGPWEESPLFWIQRADVKQMLNLPLTESYFSFKQLNQALFTDEITNLNAVKPLLTYYFIQRFKDSLNRSRSEKLELSDLAAGLWVMLKNNDLVVISAPSDGLWHFLKPGMVIAKDVRLLQDRIEKSLKGAVDEILSLSAALYQFAQWNGSDNINAAMESTLAQLQAKHLSKSDVARVMDENFPPAQRYGEQDLLKLLPGKDGRWFSLTALTAQEYDTHTNSLKPVGNFTLYSDSLFQKLRTTYLTIKTEIAALPKLPKNFTKTPLIIQQIEAKVDQLSALLIEGYQSIANTPYLKAQGKNLRYPSFSQLQLEHFYYNTPLLWPAIGLYILSTIFFILNYKWKNQWIHLAAWIGVFGAFCFHTTALILRCIVLQRPPVSNMFETVIYVPWIAVIASLILYILKRQPILLIGSSLASIALLIVLELANLNSGLENVQAVLDSQYWLIVHVLLVVGSYGVFALCGILGQIYLIFCAFNKHESPQMKAVASSILQTMYIGVAMLISGTILGGVWAAESWGRFWDWDPKESWAFISSCIYLIFIHAYTFGYIHYVGLAIGAIVGIMAISFTWYGVNYILGVGLHTYGFGSGGEKYYYAFLIAEFLFIISIACLTNWRKKAKMIK